MTANGKGPFRLKKGSLKNSEDCSSLSGSQDRLYESQFRFHCPPLIYAGSWWLGSAWDLGPRFQHFVGAWKSVVFAFVCNLMYLHLYAIFCICICMRSFVLVFVCMYLCLHPYESICICKPAPISSLLAQLASLA